MAPLMRAPLPCRQTFATLSAYATGHCACCVVPSLPWRQRTLLHALQSSLLLAAGLLSANVPNNGLMLCIPCHRLHDAFMWCFDPPKGVVVANALLNDEELGPAWRGRAGARLSQPDAADAVKAAWWPPATVWAAEVTRFEAARAERHAEADKRPFACGKCRKRFVLARGVANHKCGPGGGGAQVEAGAE